MYACTRVPPSLSFSAHLQRGMLYILAGSLSLHLLFTSRPFGFLPFSKQHADSCARARELLLIFLLDARALRFILGLVAERYVKNLLLLGCANKAGPRD